MNVTIFPILNSDVSKALFVFSDDYYTNDIRMALRHFVELINQNFILEFNLYEDDYSKFNVSVFVPGGYEFFSKDYDINIIHSESYNYKFSDSDVFEKYINKFFDDCFNIFNIVASDISNFLESEDIRNKTLIYPVNKLS